MSDLPLTAEQKEKMRRQARLRRARDRERELLGKPPITKEVKANVREFYDAKKIVDSADDIIHSTADLSRERNKDVPYAIGKSGNHHSKDVSLTKELRAVLWVKAIHVEDAKAYCQLSGIDPEVATVKQCVVHNMIYWTLKGSAPHMKELMERIDGKIVPTADPGAKGKMSVTDAMNMLELKSDDDSEGVDDPGDD